MKYSIFGSSYIQICPDIKDLIFFEVKTSIAAVRRIGPNITKSETLQKRRRERIAPTFSVPYPRPIDYEHEQCDLLSLDAV